MKKILENTSEVLESESENTSEVLESQKSTSPKSVKNNSPKKKQPESKSVYSAPVNVFANTTKTFDRTNLKPLYQFPITSDDVSLYSYVTKDTAVEVEKFGYFDGDGSFNSYINVVEVYSEFDTDISKFNRYKAVKDVSKNTFVLKSIS